MPNLIKQGEARVVTKNGEIFVNIALELSIKLDGSNLVVGAGAPATKAEDKVSWEIPDFTSNKIDFGRDKEKN